MNSIQYYLTKGRGFEQDIFIVAFCMNDIVNPRLHWNYTKESIVNIPEEAIPNHEYDIKHALPKMALLKYSRLYRALEPRIWSITKNIAKARSNTLTYITGEDTISIEVLLDRSSPEWRWLTSIYDQLNSAVRADQATFVIALFPLAYQLDEDYPFFPQKQIAEYCMQNSILYIDLLASFMQHPKKEIFLLKLPKSL